MSRGDKEETEGSLPTATQLPNEIIRLVFNHLREDKDTLATCMRVSPTWNVIAAPVLYHTVKVTYPTYTSDPFAKKSVSRGSNPFHIPAKKKWVTRKRKIPSKEKNLEHIRHVTFADHDVRQCKEAMRTFHQSSIRKLSLDSIRFDTEFDEDDPHRYPHWYDQHRGKHFCEVGQKLSASRVIVFSTAPIYAVPPVSAAETVCVFSRGSEPDEWYPHDEHQPPINPSSRIVYIYRPDTPHGAFYGKGDLWEDDGEPKSVFLWTDLRNRVKVDAWDSPTTKEVIVVGIESLQRALRTGPADTSHLIDLTAQLKQHVADAKPGNWRDNKPFELKIVTMEEYLRDHDWTGVFTEEEVEGWL